LEYGKVSENFRERAMHLVITPYDPENVPKEEEVALPDPRFYEAAVRVRSFALLTCEEVRKWDRRCAAGGKVIGRSIFNA